MCRPDDTTLNALRDEIQRRLPDYLADLETLVNIESVSQTRVRALPDATNGTGQRGKAPPQWSQTVYSACRSRP